MSEETPVKIEWPTGLGAVLAVIVLILCVVLPLVGHLPAMLAILIGLLALARLT